MDDAVEFYSDNRGMEGRCSRRKVAFARFNSNMKKVLSFGTEFAFPASSFTTMTKMSAVSFQQALTLKGLYLGDESSS